MTTETKAMVVKKPALSDNAEVGLVKREYAAYILRRLWPGITNEALVRAALIAVRYQLDPLIGELVMVQYGESWAPLISIKATRKRASRNGTRRYSYADGPRLMTPTEQESIFGEVFKDKYAAICVVEIQGARYPGYGLMGKEERVQGTNNGNSRFNMAFIRAERSALDKAFPGELPEIDVADQDIAKFGAPVDEATLIEGARQADAKAEQAKDDLYGPEAGN